MAGFNVASAVVLPEPEEFEESHEADAKSPSQQNNRRKRRQSSVSQANRTEADAESTPTEPKRPRLSTSTSSFDNNRRPSESGPPSARPTLAPTDQEERKRGKRLFGGLISTLSQASTSSTRGAATAEKQAAQQQRRADIERKQAEKLRAADEAFEEEQRLRRTQLGQEREKRQRRVEEDRMRVRHANERATAGYLKTKTQPTLYYKPYELLPSERDTISAQTVETEVRIAREVAQFEERKKQWEREDVGEQADTSITQQGQQQSNGDEQTDHPKQPADAHSDVPDLNYDAQATVEEAAQTDTEEHPGANTTANPAPTDAAPANGTQHESPSTAATTSVVDDGAAAAPPDSAETQPEQQQQQQPAQEYEDEQEQEQGNEHEMEIEDAIVEGGAEDPVIY